MSIGEAIAQDLRAMFDSPDFVTEVADEMGDIHVDSIIENSRNTVGAADQQFMPLSEMYGQHKLETVGNSEPNLEYGHRQPSAWDLLDHSSTNEETLYDFSGDQRVLNYMTEHQEGINGMPERRWFPDQARGDEQSATQQANAEEIERVLGEYLNKDRTIMVGQ